MNSLKSIIVFVDIILSWIIYGCSFFFPRNKRVWIFVGWYKNQTRQTFADNSKYAFLNTNHNHPEIKAIWIAPDRDICTILRARGYSAYYIHSFLGTYYSLRAKYTIIDAVMQTKNWRLSGGSKTIQLWHADGIKKLSFTSRWSIDKFSKIFIQPGSFKKFHFIISSSDYIRKNFTAPSFGVDDRDVRITGLPRYDAFFKVIAGAEIDLHTELQANLETIRSHQPDRIFLYAPTFRRGRSVPGQLEHLNLRILNDFLKLNNFHMVISLHPKFSASNWEPDEIHSNISYSNAGYDFYPLLPEFDVLITDYSSTCIEFLLLDKPTIFYTYDIGEYRRNEGLSEEFWNYMPGLRVSTFDDLTTAMCKSKAELMKGSESVRNTIFKYKDGDSSSRFVNEILKELRVH